MVFFIHFPLFFLADWLIFFLRRDIALVCVVPKDKLTINGPVKKWQGTGSSGKAVWRLFCSECGSPIAHDPEAAPEIIALKGGTLDSEIKKNLKPVRYISLSPCFLPLCNPHTPTHHKQITPFFF